MPGGEIIPTNNPRRSHTRLHTMWIGNVRNLPFEDQLRTTAAVDLDELSMTPLDFDRNIARGLSARDMRKMAEDSGVSLPILDPLASWAPHWTSGVSDPLLMQFLGYAPDDFFRIAGELQASTMTVIGTFSPGRVPIAQVTESFAAIADKAAAHGLHCVLEFIPIWGIGDLTTAWPYRKDCEPFQCWPCIRLLALYSRWTRRHPVAIYPRGQDLICTGGGR